MSYSETTDDQFEQKRMQKHLRYVLIENQL